MSRRILIVDATATNRIALKAMLSAARYDVAAVSTGAQALDAIKTQAPDAILLDFTLPDMRADAFCQQASRILGERMPPILALIEDLSPDVRLGALESGATTLVTRPVSRPWLLTNLRALLRASETRSELRRRSLTAAQVGFAEDPGAFDAPARIAIVSGHPLRAKRLARALRAIVPHRMDVLSPEQALIAADDPDAAPQLMLLCPSPSGDDDLSLLSELRARPGTKRAAILMQYDPDGRDIAARALDQGANDLVRSDALVAEAALRLDRQLVLKRQSDALRASVDAGLILAAHDPLTGLFNRRYAMRYLDDLGTSGQDGGRAYGLLLLDVDNFKAINDAHGHATGDAVLAQVARRLADNVREGDLLARIGGEEFLVALPTCQQDEARIAAERLRAAISSAPFAIPSGEMLRVTLSVGTICGIGAPDGMLSQADAALYVAKKAGRNRVAVADPPRMADDLGAVASEAKPSGVSKVVHLR